MTTPPSPEELQTGLARLHALVDRFDNDALKSVLESSHARQAQAQPWLIAGVSAGMGLHVALAGLQSGLIREGVGVYWEPPALLQKLGGRPMSPVHHQRWQNAHALELFAKQRGVDFTVLPANLVLAPQRGPDASIEEPPPPFPVEVREVVDTARERARDPDLIFVDSVAFARWICPREGAPPVEAFDLDTSGKIVKASTKRFDPRGYEETLDTMGRNHLRLLENFRRFGWLGRRSMSTLFTYAGGSQEIVAETEGIYGRAALGDAKIIAETELVEFRLKHGRHHGDHAIVRLPTFWSNALAAIPGGVLRALVTRDVLHSRGVFRDVPALATAFLSELLGSRWARENPVAQIQLDTAEVLFQPEIDARMAIVNDRIRLALSDSASSRDPLDGAQLLREFIPREHPELLARLTLGEA